jgi:hypothetical protein
MGKYYGVIRSDEYLAHYGIKGMKWGVRKALERNDFNAYNRQYRKAIRKLTKLERQATSGKKYTRRAAGLGTAAGVVGGAALAGTANIANLVRTTGAIKKSILNRMGRTNDALVGEVNANKAADAIAGWGASKPFEKGADARFEQAVHDINRKVYGSHENNPYTQMTIKDRRAAYDDMVKRAQNRANFEKSLTNDQLARVGAGVVAAGLAAGAGYNAYRAATTKRAAQKADQWRKEIENTFGPGTAVVKKKRRNDNG